MNEFDYQPEENGRRKIVIGVIAGAVLLVLIVGVMVFVMRKRAAGTEVPAVNQGTVPVNGNVSNPVTGTGPTAGSNEPFVPLAPIKPEPPPYPFGEEHVMTDAEKQQFGYGGVTGEVRYMYVADDPKNPDSGYTRVVTKSPEPVPAQPIDPSKNSPKSAPPTTP